MLKNLIRLSLLDFFELTAAFGVALYVFQANDWNSEEKAWLVGAFAVAAIALWIATRLGEKSPAPGLFFACYTGAALGVSDLSPWFMLLDFDFVSEGLSDVVSYFGYDNKWAQSFTVAGCLVAMMLAPALVATAIWHVASTLIQLVQKRTKCLATMKSKAKFATSAFACLSITSLAGWSTYSNPATHIRSVLVSHELPGTTNAGGEEVGEEVGSGWLGSLDSWAISADGERLLILRQGRDLLEFALSNGAILRKITLDFGEAANGCITASRFVGNLQVTCTPAFNVNSIDHHMKVWSLDDNHLLVCVDFLANAPPNYYLFDLRTGKLDEQFQNLKLSARIRSVSANGVYAVVEEFGDDPTRLDFAVWNLATLQRQAEPNIPSLDYADAEFAINHNGTVVQKRAPREFPLIPRGASIADAVAPLPSHQISPAGEWLCRDERSVFEMRAVVSREGETFDLPFCGVDSCWIGTADRTPLLDPYRGKILVLQNDLFAHYGRFLHVHTPIVGRLLDDSYRSRLFQFDPLAKKLTSTSIAPLKFSRPSTFSAKFSPCGKYLWVMDTAENGFVFHEIAMR